MQDLQWVSSTFCGNATQPFELEGLTILGNPIGHPAFVKHHLQVKTNEISQLLSVLKSVQNPQTRLYLFLKSVQL